MTPDECNKLTKDATTIADVIKELRRLLPTGTFATVTVHEHGELNRPESIIKTVDSAEIYVEGGYWFRGGSLRDAMTEFRKWYKGVTDGIG